MKKILFMISLFFITTILSEFILRAYFLGFRNIFNPISFFINDIRYGYKPVPNSQDLRGIFKWDSLGFRFNYKLISKNKKTILCMGETTTFGSDNLFNKTYPYLLDSLYNDSFNVINAEVSGWSISQHYYRFNDYIINTIKPDIIILHSVFNSFLYPKFYFKHNNWLTYILFNKSILFRILDKILAITIKHSFHYPIFNKKYIYNEYKIQQKRLLQHNGIKKYQKTLSEFIKTCINNKIKLFIIIPPCRADNKFIKQLSKYDKLYLQIRNILESIIIKECKIYNIPYFDLKNIFYNTHNINKFFLDAIHLSDKKNLIFAKELKKRLDDYVK